MAQAEVPWPGEIPARSARPTCPETLKTGPQKNCEADILTGKKLAVSCGVSPPVAVAIAGLLARGVGGLLGGLSA